MRKESFVFMLDFTDFKELGRADFFIAFGQEKIFQSHFNDDVWNIEDKGLIKELDWNGLKVVILGLITESWEMGILYDINAMRDEFQVVYNDKRIMNMLDE